MVSFFSVMISFKACSSLWILLIWIWSDSTADTCSESTSDGSFSRTQLSVLGTEQEAWEELSVIIDTVDETAVATDEVTSDAVVANETAADEVVSVSVVEQDSVCDDRTSGKHGASLNSSSCCAPPGSPLRFCFAFKPEEILANSRLNFTVVIYWNLGHRTWSQANSALDDIPFFPLKLFISISKPFGTNAMVDAGETVLKSSPPQEIDKRKSFVTPCFLEYSPIHSRANSFDKKESISTALTDLSWYRQVWIKCPTWAAAMLESVHSSVNKACISFSEAQESLRIKWSCRSSWLLNCTLILWLSLSEGRPLFFGPIRLLRKLYWSSPGKKKRRDVC